MSGSGFKTVATASVLASSILYIGYLWYKHREEQQEDSYPPSPISPSGVTEIQLDKVQEKLQSIKRSRLDTLEEEPVTHSTPFEEPPSKEAQLRDSKPVVQFGSTDIRYRHLEQTETCEYIIVKEDAVETLKETEEVVVESTRVSKETITKATSEDIHVPTVNISEATSAESKVSEEINPLPVEVEKDSDKNCSEMAVDDTVNFSAPVPDVVSALNDPLCGSGSGDITPPSPHSYSSSPVKSESAQSKSSCDWSDLIEQDEKEIQEFQLDSRELTCKLSGLELGSGRSNDSGVASPSEEGDNRDQDTGAKSRTQSGEDPGIGGSEPGDDVGDSSIDDHQLLAYHFNIPDYLCGKLIGIEGSFINELKTECRVNIFLKELTGDIEKKTRKFKHRKDRRRNYYDESTIKICCIEGTRTNIDKTLSKLKKKFYSNTELTFEQVNRSSSTCHVSQGHASLSLAEGVMHDVFVSSIVGGGHVFLQQPCHPTYFALERLDQCMSNTYSQFNCPAIPQPVVLNSVCAAPCDGGWFRCQVVAFDEETKMCDIKYLDYGGYSSISADSLRQIRTDFLSLPFQAIECYLANIQPSDDENVSALVLEELVSCQVVQARMIGTNEQGIPMIHLYRAVSGQTTMVNQELVDRSCANWLDTTIVKLDSPMDHPSVMWSNLGNFQNRNLGPDAWTQLNIIYFIPEISKNPEVDPQLIDLDHSFEAPMSIMDHQFEVGYNCSNISETELFPASTDGTLYVDNSFGAQCIDNSNEVPFMDTSFGS